MQLHALVSGTAMLVGVLGPQHQAVWTPFFGEFPILRVIGACKLMAFAALRGAGDWLPPFCWVQSGNFWDLTANACLVVVYMGGAYTHVAEGDTRVAGIGVGFAAMGMARLYLKTNDEKPHMGDKKGA
eukprot:TRINITY_DN20917_c0_g1_i2.p1 TRINITY_DN20917_c0_g1~~TRINITY_DN20917_c0_g1_i2.p1  ORF type:complete len:128 (+),score=15.09 TRINITY_DN20917_c0_g1_i2:227-610(+)